MGMAGNADVGVVGAREAASYAGLGGPRGETELEPLPWARGETARFVGLGGGRGETELEPLPWPRGETARYVGLVGA